MKKLIFLFLLLPILNHAQKTFYGKEPLAHTYSIVAIDEETGEMGVAVQSHWFSVGSLVTWGEAGVGVVATQSFVNPAYGPNGLTLLKMGFSAEEALKVLLEKDEGRDVRQVAILDANGNVAVHTGKSCIEAAGHVKGKGFSVQANLMENDKVWPAMANAFADSKGEPLAERMMSAMEAAQHVGGDIRGKQSAAILVVKAKSTGNSWEDRSVDLRIEDHAEPIKEMRRLLKVHRAYEHMNKGDLAVEHNDIDLAMKEYGAAEALFPENEEMKYWHALTLLNVGETEKGMALLKQVYNKNAKWSMLTPRLSKNGLLTVEGEVLKQVLGLGK